MSLLLATETRDTGVTLVHTYEINETRQTARRFLFRPYEVTINHGGVVLDDGDDSETMRQKVENYLQREVRTYGGYKYNYEVCVDGEKQVIVGAFRHVDNINMEYPKNKAYNTLICKLPITSKQAELECPIEYFTLYEYDHRYHEHITVYEYGVIEGSLEDISVDPEKDTDVFHAVDNHLAEYYRYLPRTEVTIVLSMGSGSIASCKRVVNA